MTNEKLKKVLEPECFIRVNTGIPQADGTTLGREIYDLALSQAVSIKRIADGIDYLTQMLDGSKASTLSLDLQAISHAFLTRKL